MKRLEKDAKMELSVEMMECDRGEGRSEAKTDDSLSLWKKRVNRGKVLVTIMRARVLGEIKE